MSPILKNLSDLTLKNKKFSASFDPIDYLKHSSLNDITGFYLTSYTLPVAVSFTRLLKSSVSQESILGFFLFSIYTPIQGDPS